MREREREKKKPKEKTQNKRQDIDWEGGRRATDWKKGSGELF